MALNHVLAVGHYRLCYTRSARKDGWKWSGRRRLQGHLRREGDTENDGRKLPSYYLG